jgi:predicted short-subunit dehydrogenase-like oxidoreductase (DUF2520 family)
MSAPQRARSLTVGLIGTGRVGSVLAAALAAAGHRIVAATGGSPDSLDRADRLLPGVPLLPADEVAARAELVLVAVPDDVLGPLVAGLAELGAWRPGQLSCTPRARTAPRCWRPPPGPAPARSPCTRR